MEALVVQAQAGDISAFEQLAEAHLPRLYRVAVGLVGIDDAADITQDALVSAWRQLPQLREPSRFAAWTNRILVNHSRNHLRTRRRRPPGLVLEESVWDTRTGTIRVDAGIFISEAVADLPRGQRLAVVLHYFGGLTLKEVAAALGIRESAVKSRLYLARNTLRATLEA